MRKTEERSLEKLKKNLNAETKCENYKRNKSSIYGITLIALVITIIVLLILAGITISTLTGENGILVKATQARSQTEQGNAEDRIKLMLNEWYMEKSLGNDVSGFFDKKVNSKEIDSWTDNQDGTYDIEVDGYVCTINENGEFIEEVQKKGPRPQVSSVTIQDESGNSVDASSQEDGTKLYINIEATIEGGTIKSISPSVPYEVTKNGTIEFTITGTVNGEDYVTKHKVIVDKYAVRAGLKVGDYINYTPDTNSTGYSKDKLNSTYTGSSSNSSDLTQDTLNWQILRIYEDGRMDLIGSPTSQNVYFQGATGYNNGVTVMNDICKELYSKNTKGITARSVKLEDMESWLTESGKTARGSYSNYTDGPKYGHTQTYVTKRYYPKLYEQQIGGKIDSGATEGIDVEEGNKTGLTESQEGTASGSTQASTNITVTQTYYNISIDSTNYGDGAKALSSGEYYWVASRCARCNSSYACFGLRYAYASMRGIDMFYSSKSTYNGSNRLRPVVSLGSEVQVETCSGTNSTTNMHTITQY